MQSVHPRADLAPRDIVARAIVREMKRLDLPYVYLDITAQSRAFLHERFPVIYEECMKRGIDIAVNWIPVMPVQHYFMGGIQTDINGQSTMPGLYACGESACTGVHGANRLASNSLLECLVFGRRCAQSINKLEDHRIPTIDWPKPGPSPVKPELPHSASEVDGFDFETCRSQIRNTMTQNGGIIRNAQGLNEALSQIDDILGKLQHQIMADRLSIETLNMATVADKILRAAILRPKSVGAHFRDDDEAAS